MLLQNVIGNNSKSRNKEIGTSIKDINFQTCKLCTYTYIAWFEAVESFLDMA